MVIVIRVEVSSEERRAVALLLGKSGEAKHNETKSFCEAILKSELEGAVADYRETFPEVKPIKNTGQDIGMVFTNGQQRPIYSVAQINKGKNAGRYEVEIKKGSGFKKIAVKFSDFTLKGGAEWNTKKDLLSSRTF
jgi:hypothetical protein